MNVTELLGRQNHGALIGLGTILFAIAAIVDAIAVPGFETSIIYLIPISFFAWFIGRQIGLILSAFSASITLGFHFSERSHVFSPAVIYWNALAWFGVYVFFVFIIAELRNLYERERHFSRTDPVDQDSESPGIPGISRRGEEPVAAQ